MSGGSLNTQNKVKAHNKSYAKLVLNMGKAKKATDETMGKPLTSKRQRELTSATWEAILYLSEIDNVDNLSYTDIRRAYDNFKLVCDLKFGLPCAYILHDQDEKPHIHFVARLNHFVGLTWWTNYINETFGSVCTEVTSVLCNPVRDVRHYVECYFLHIGYPDKHQYDANERVIKGSLFDVSYSDFMQMVMSCDSFKEVAANCAGDEKLAKLFVKHSYFVKTYFYELKE